ncbi:hypothetical protein M5K25_021235 [Dendrobium thyrsiflorum]|uniref:Uncharacterized protein n=1 Tax=Dendrobium thyrsiflorum TaxID=117978 RepID=A0ABD0UIV8_DENTH
MEQVRAEMQEKHFGIEERFSGLEGSFSSMESRFGNIEGMMKILIEMQSKALPATPKADWKGKKVQDEDDEEESVFPQGPPRSIPRGSASGYPEERECCLFGFLPLSLGFLLSPFGSYAGRGFSVAVPVPAVWDFVLSFGFYSLALRFPAVPCFELLFY